MPSAVEKIFIFHLKQHLSNIGFRMNGTTNEIFMLFSLLFLRARSVNTICVRHVAKTWQPSKSLIVQVGSCYFITGWFTLPIRVVIIRIRIGKFENIFFLDQIILDKKVTIRNKVLCILDVSILFVLWSQANN